MSFGLFNPEFPFYRLFQEQWTVLQRAAVLLEGILTDFHDLPARGAVVHGLEAEQIRLFREVYKELGLTLIQPLARHDIYELNQAFDESMRAVKAVVTRMGLYGFAAPQAAAREIAGNLVEIINGTGVLLKGLRTAGPQSLALGTMDALRDETRMLFLVGVGELYEAEVDTPRQLLEVMKWSQIYDRLETAFDCSVAIARAVAAIILKNT